MKIITLEDDMFMPSETLERLHFDTFRLVDLKDDILPRLRQHGIAANPQFKLFSNVSKVKCCVVNFPILKTCRGRAFSENPNLVCSNCYAKIGPIGFSASREFQERVLALYKTDPSLFWEYLQEDVHKARILVEKRTQRILSRGYVEREKKIYQITRVEEITTDDVKLNPFRFRWCSAGDIPDNNFLPRAAQFAINNPNLRFWIPTLNEDFVKDFIKKYEMPPNLVIRISSPIVDKPVILSQRMIDAGIRSSYTYLFNPINQHQGQKIFKCIMKCTECFYRNINGACWNKDVICIGYEIHKGEEKSPSTTVEAIGNNYPFIPNRQGLLWRKPENVLKHLVWASQNAGKNHRKLFTVSVHGHSPEELENNAVNELYNFLHGRLTIDEIISYLPYISISKQDDPSGLPRGRRPKNLAKTDQS